MSANITPGGPGAPSRWPAWWPDIFLRRKVYALVTLLLTIRAGIWMKGEDFGWGYISLAVPLFIAGILWVCPFRFSEMQADRSKDSKASANPPVVLKNRIILFSDGTGNSSAKLFKTNVWRMYQLIDFGPDPDCHVLQIGSYNNGVGTSSFKPLAILGGIFGFGLQANVLHLYRFLCRNYKDGDEILTFGFSRGAFTIRMLVALIADQGVLTDYVDERDLAYRSRAIYREFMRRSLPTVFPFIAVSVRFLRDIVLRAAAWLMDPRRKPNVIARPDISFVGLWDTVAAYGGPITEITRGIDKWVAPLTMTDYMLSPKVKLARHALALDDERDSFQPLVWDELHEAELAQALSAAQAELARFPEGSAEAAAFKRERVDPLANCLPGRVKQVWFAGMHADVGGGYPDESLSYVSLLWMIDEIGTRLRLLDEDVKRLRASSNMLGPIHDSREGLASYYRYQPRKIDALLHHDGDTAMMERTLSLRDPNVYHKPWSVRWGFVPWRWAERPRGLLLRCRIHVSVLIRIATGADNYAPIGLPKTFEVEGTDKMDGTHGAEVWRAMAANLTQDADLRAQRQDQIWSYVWARRWVYFLTLGMTLVLIALPKLLSFGGELAQRADDRWIGGMIANKFAPFLPSFTKLWFVAFDESPFAFIVVISIILVLIAGSVLLERILRDRTRQLWWSVLEREPIAAKPDGSLTRLRHKQWYQWTLQFLKWRLMPNLLGALMAFGVLYSGVVVVAQLYFSVAERSTIFCNTRSQEPDRLTFLANSPCNNTGIDLMAGHTYRLTFTVEQPAVNDAIWKDDTIETPFEGKSSWRGFDHPLESLKFLASAPFRRIVPARWLQPLYAIRENDGGRPEDADKLGDRIFVAKIPFAPERKIKSTNGSVTIEYNADINTQLGGRLFLFANDVGAKWAYDNNSGTAAISVEMTK